MKLSQTTYAPGGKVLQSHIIQIANLAGLDFKQQYNQEASRAGFYRFLNLMELSHVSTVQPHGFGRAF